MQDAEAAYQAALATLGQLEQDASSGSARAGHAVTAAWADLQAAGDAPD